MKVGTVLCCLCYLSVIRLHSRVTSVSARAEVVPPHACLAGGSAFLALSLGLLGAHGIWVCCFLSRAVTAGPLFCVGPAQFVRIIALQDQLCALYGLVSKACVIHAPTVGNSCAHSAAIREEAMHTCK